MVVGIDVCKDAFSKNMAVVGFVASVNPQITRYCHSYPILVFTQVFMFS